MLFATVASVEILAAASLVGGLLSAIAHGHWRTWRSVAWLGIGVLGLPAMILTFLYIVGFAIALVVFWVSAVCARWPFIAQAFVAMCVIAAALLIGISSNSTALHDLLLAAFLGVSASCALVATAKLGRTFGSDTIWEASSEKHAVVPGGTGPVRNAL
jgi:hypothetical protein